MQFFLQKRSHEKDSFPNQWDISSAGHIPAGDDWKESALRELSEELGLKVSEDELLDAGLYRISCDDVFHGKPFHDRQVSRIFLLFKDLLESDFKIQKEELSEAALRLRSTKGLPYPHALQSALFIIFCLYVG